MRSYLLLSIQPNPNFFNIQQIMTYSTMTTLFFTTVISFITLLLLVIPTQGQQAQEIILYNGTTCGGVQIYRATATSTVTLTGNNTVRSVAVRGL